MKEEEECAEVVRVADRKVKLWYQLLKYNTWQEVQTNLSTNLDSEGQQMVDEMKGNWEFVKSQKEIQTKRLPPPGGGRKTKHSFHINSS